MKRLPKNRFTERLNNIYDELHLDSEKRILADSVVSNLIELEFDEFYPFYDRTWDIGVFYDMMDRLSQSDDFMDLLSENDGNHMYDMFMQILDKNTGVKYDILNELFDIIRFEDDEHIEKKDIVLIKGVDAKIAELDQIDSWYKYLNKEGLYENYKNIKNKHID